jgi:hypothetical protein
MFKFTIRELLLLTLVVAMGVGWWLDHRFLSEEAQSQKQLRSQFFALYVDLKMRTEDPSSPQLKFSTGPVDPKYLSPNPSAKK